MDVAVLGLGAMGSGVVGHLRALPQVRRIVGHDLDRDRMQRLSIEKRIEAAPDLDAVLSDPKIRLAFVTAPNDAHKELALRALAAGKAVLCEKPLATTLADARQIVAASRQQNAFLQVGFELRYSKLYVQIKQWIDEGLLGRVVNTHCLHMVSEYWGSESWRVRDDATGGMFAEKLCHYVDLPRWWVGEPWTRVRTVCAPNVIPYFEIRDNYHTTYEFAGGAASHLTFAMGPPATFHGDPLQNIVDQQQGDGHTLRYYVFGTKGCAEADVFSRQIKRWQYDVSKKSFTSRLVEELTWPAAEDHFHVHNTTDQTRDIIDRVERGLPPMTSAEDAYQSMALTFAAEQSAKMHGSMIAREEIERLVA